MKKVNSAIKMVDLAAQNAEIEDEVKTALAQIHRHTAYTGGPQVESFEHEFADYLGVQHVVGVSSGTDALHLTLRALEVGADDEVITSPMTFIATAEAIVQSGATVTFVDIDPATRNLSAAAVRRYLDGGRFRSRNGPKVILPVHLYGSPAPMAELREIGERYRLEIVEDACQAHGATVAFADRWVHAGTAGIAGCFSFYPGKNLGGWGDAGAIATDDAELAGRVASLRDHGRISHYAHQECGYNARLDSIQAAVLQAKLKHLDRWNARRRELANTYAELLAGCDISLPSEPAYAESCYHLFVIQSVRRDALRTALLAKKIECGIHYPVPLHLLPALGAYGYRQGDFPVSERVADTVLSLPMHPHLTNLALERVAGVIEQEIENPQSSLAGEQYDITASLPPAREG